MTGHTRYLTGPLGKQTRPKVIELQQITLMQEWQMILQDVTLDIFEGESVALLGSSDSGKSALLACIQGQIRPVRGRVSVLGADTLPFPPNIRRQIGVLPQQLEHRNGETILAYLQRCASYHEVQLNNAQVAAYCAHYQLPPEQPVATLTGLQARIFALAQALVHDPCLVLLEEPLSGLSTQEQVEFWPYLQRTQREGRTLLCTFTLPLAENYLSGYDLIVKIEQGRLSRPEG